MMRGFRTIVRLPSAFFPSLAMPVFTMIAFSGTYFAITKLSGFPTDRSTNWFGIQRNWTWVRHHSRY
jgi:ABC-2 type transport system permease protein